MGTIQMIGALIMVSLFAIALITFGINFANDNSAPVSIANDTEISSLKSSTDSGLKEFQTDTEGQYQSILDTTVPEGSDASQSSAPYAVTYSNVITVTKNILKVGYNRVTGGEAGFSIFFESLIAFILFALALYLVKTWRGYPD